MTDPSEKTVKRYDAGTCCGQEACYCSSEDRMQKYEHGEWVRSSDYDAERKKSDAYKESAAHFEMELFTEKKKLGEAEATLSKQEGVIEKLGEALKKCSSLFSEIRGDWTDPRHECREGWRIVSEALALLQKDKPEGK